LALDFNRICGAGWSAEFAEAIIGFDLSRYLEAFVWVDGQGEVEDAGGVCIGKRRACDES